MSDCYKYVIRQGDDSDFMGNNLSVVLYTPDGLDLTGYTADVTIATLSVYHFDDITSKILPITITAAQSATLPEGNIYPTIKITSPIGKIINDVIRTPIFVERSL